MAIVELVVIAFCWHPFMAFIVPLAVASTLTSSRRMVEALPLRLAALLRHREASFLVAMAVWTGLVMGAQVAPWHAIPASLVSLAVIGTLFHLFTNSTGGGHDMEDLLPDDGERTWLLGGLLVYYLIATPLFNPDALPGPLQQLRFGSSTWCSSSCSRGPSTLAATGQ